MGGKDTMVVDKDADLELAAQSIVNQHSVSQDKNVLLVHVPHR